MCTKLRTVFAAIAPFPFSLRYLLRFLETSDCALYKSSMYSGTAYSSLTFGLFSSPLFFKKNCSTTFSIFLFFADTLKCSRFCKGELIVSDARWSLAEFVADVLFMTIGEGRSSDCKLLSDWTLLSEVTLNWELSWVSGASCCWLCCDWSLLSDNECV